MKYRVQLLVYYSVLRLIYQHVSMLLHHDSYFLIITVEILLCMTHSQYIYLREHSRIMSRYHMGVS